MAHKGEIIENAVRKTQISITRVAENTKLSRKQIYNIFANPDVSNEVMLKIGKAINHDFSVELPHLKKLYATYPEYIPKMLRQEEEKIKHLNSKRTTISVEIDGSPESLESAIDKIKKMNEVITSL